MPIPEYGALVGTATKKLDSAEALKKDPKGSPHYEILIDADDVQYRIAVNVKSDQNPPDLQVHLDDNYQHPILDAIKQLPVGFTALDPKPDTAALDFIRGNLFDLNDMQIVPATGESGNDLNDIFDVHVEQAFNTKGALIYAFGSKWDPEKAPDEYFGFTPGQGIHDIHMNQGNAGAHAKDNGVYQDGALFIFYPDEQRWTALFTKFQSQVVHTSDDNATPIPNPSPVPPEEDTAVRIFAALVNPKGDDTGKEEVYLLNTTGKSISLEGWAIADKQKKKEMLKGTIAAGDTLRYQLSGKTAQLSNQGGIITLLNEKGLKISGVSYTSGQAAQQGSVIQF